MRVRATVGRGTRLGHGSRGTPISPSTPSGAPTSTAAASRTSTRTSPRRASSCSAELYRSTQTILDAANAVISHNTERRPKKLWTAAGPGEKIVGYAADDGTSEASWMARR